MTAGHCGSITGAVATGTPAAWPAATYTVRMGSNKRGQGTAHSVSEVLPSPAYLLTTGYDLTLLKLTAPVTAVPSTPVAGPALTGTWAPETLETVVGWGTTSSGGSSPSILQQADVPIVADAKCAAAYADQKDRDPFWSGFDPQSMICAGFPQGGVDTCQGDSGGPMFGRKPGTGELRLVAATSYGEGCADPDYPGIYARVADRPIRDWVASVAGAASVQD
jgi:secreted trypsin-like serine protease